MKKLDREALLADRASIQALLASIPVEDVLGRTSLQARLADVEEQLTRLERELSTAGSVALMFGGQPVHGSRSIDAEFTAKALRTFHNLVRKKVAFAEFGSLGERGPIPRRGVGVDLAITEIVRGSMGFLLEEKPHNEELADTIVKVALDSVADLVIKTASVRSEDFEDAADTLDSRLLVSLKKFFRTLDDSGATLRIVEDERDATLDSAAVQRARERVDAMEITDSESDSVVGELLGLLPDSRRFEMRLRGSDEVIKGPVAAAVREPYLALIEGPQPEGGIVGRHWRVRMRIREIRERNKPPRKLYYLIGLLEPISADGSDPVQT